MARRYYGLPSLTALATFESAARNDSFTLAARELNVTPGAVSRQIKTLEDELGIPLFNRNPNGAHVTAEAEPLYAALVNGFSSVSDIIKQIKGPNEQVVTIACTNAMAELWLMPRMGKFNLAHPDIPVDHLISDQSSEFRRTEVDLRIRYGSGDWDGELATLLMKDRLYPVCSPDYAARHPNATAADLPDMDLLHVDWVDPYWTDWDELFRRAGISHATLGGRRVSNFAVTLRACEEHHGVAIGWDRLIRDRIMDGRLVPFTDLAIDAPGAYYLTVDAHHPLAPAAGSLRSWLLEQASST